MQKSKAFYCDILGFTLQGEFYRAERDSWKGDLALNGEYVIELFSSRFPSAPEPPLKPGLRHLAFSVDDVDAAVTHLEAHGVTEGVRIDPSPVSGSPFLTIRTVYRWRFISSNSCQSVFCR